MKKNPSERTIKEVGLTSKGIALANSILTNTETRRIITERLRGGFGREPSAREIMFAALLDHAKQGRLAN